MKCSKCGKKPARLWKYEKDKEDEWFCLNCLSPKPTLQSALICSIEPEKITLKEYIYD